MQDNSLVCIAFFATDIEQTSFTIKTIDLDTDDRVLIYSNNNNLLYQMNSFDLYTFTCASFALFYRTDSYQLQGSISVFETDKFIATGEHSLQVDNSLVFDILPYHYLLVHNHQYFTIEAPVDAQKYDNGAYYFTEMAEIKITPTEASHKIHFSVLTRPYVYCKDVTIFDGYDTQFLISGPPCDKQCFILTSPYIIDYYIYVQNLGDALTIYAPNADIRTRLSNEYGFITRGNSYFFHISAADNSSNCVICLQKCEIVSSTVPGETFNNKYITEFTSQTVVEYPKLFYRFLTGFYHYYIPHNGSEVYLNRYSLYVFHNPRNFIATGSGQTFLSDQSYVINVTDMRLTIRILPLKDDVEKYLNISVFNYRKTSDVLPNCNSFDVVAVADNDKNSMSISYKADSFNSIPVNFSIAANQRVCIWYAASSPFQITLYHDELEDGNTFSLIPERFGQFPTPSTFNRIRGRSVIAKWITYNDVDGIPESGASIETIKPSSIATTELGGMFRGTRSYMDFPFAKYTSAPRITNYGVEEEKINVTQPDQNPRKLSDLHIALIVVCILVAVIVIISLVCYFKKKRSDSDHNNLKEDKHSTSDIEDPVPIQNNYFSSTPSPKSSAEATTNTTLTETTTESSNNKGNSSYEAKSI
ncbi:hypothetical protein TVAG_169050 [Trichomonas vaginalis G3]|uniref:Uncharacterized protein n=1 Tax=Trichomonas vaginalis (strain ATCC PRA-98 / G3) TaxID=412133 RepID=A2EWS3_TRIV3|nr:hypothetical protein TVAGG3_0211670 [Trichomonas vaginalis G3]EAY02903.1 hypothetical protein TVAG_169050 [Trichomonas vaginalis G3]KAI5551273.1 hypothetical protein TVAGG3_0211670 [Trichomonas vaginalis G3]|eukprot:XP_001315126.1 hypothetical protein [Trichomonas vaginalis G3]